MLIIGTPLRRWRSFKRWQKILSIVGILLTLCGIGLYFWIFADLPSIDRLEAGLALPTTRILDRHRRPLYEDIPPNGGRPTRVPLAEIPQTPVQATHSTPECKFFNTPGRDPPSVYRARLGK